MVFSRPKEGNSPTISISFTSNHLTRLCRFAVETSRLHSLTLGRRHFECDRLITVIAYSKSRISLDKSNGQNENLLNSLCVYSHMFYLSFNRAIGIEVFLAGRIQRQEVAVS